MRVCLSVVLGLLVATRAWAALSDIEASVMDKNYEQTRMLAAKLLKDTRNPSERIKAEYYLGLSHLRMGQYPEARKAFQAVMKDSRDNDLYDKAALGLVEGQYMSGFYKDAVKDGQALLRKHPESPSKSMIYLKLARAHLKMMEWQKANEFLNKIIGEFPQSLEAPIAQGLLEEKEYFAVQVGSFLERERAVKLMDELKGQSQYAYIVETNASGKTFYRVRVGQMNSLSDAQTLEGELTRLGYPTMIYP